MRQLLRPTTATRSHRRLPLLLLFPKTAPATTRISIPTRWSSTFRQPTPSPPRLPPEEQAEFERLQRESPGFEEVAVSTTTEATSQAKANPKPINDEKDPTTGGIRRGAAPEFEGDVNPKTGEVGGPKNEPLRWGAKGDYSFNGRVTDF